MAVLQQLQVGLASLVVCRGLIAWIGYRAAKPAPTWWLIVVGLLGIAAGGVTIFWPGATALVLILLIGGWAIAHGIFEIIGAIQLRKEIDNEWWLILAGALSVIFGLMVLVAPGAGALALVWVIGAYSIVVRGHASWLVIAVAEASAHFGRRSECTTLSAGCVVRGK